jgi:hypothetical protein
MQNPCSITFWRHTQALNLEGCRIAKVNVDSQGIILKGYDVVAYLKQQGKPLKGNPEIKSGYKGATYSFASAENKSDPPVGVAQLDRWLFPTISGRRPE